MKKTIAILMVLALAATAAFAQEAAVAPAITFTGWGQAGFTFAQNTSHDVDTKTPETVVGSNLPSWANGSDVGVAIAGTSKNVGFLLNIDYYAASIVAADNALIWVKFNDMFKINFGKARC